MPLKTEHNEIKAAKSAHELFMINLGALLLLGPLIIFTETGRLGIIIPIVFSSIFVLITRYKISHMSDGFIKRHWNYAFRNYRWLFLGYTITCLLFLLSWLIEASVNTGSPNQFIAIAVVRIAVMPTLIMMFFSFVIGNHALNLALRHEVPE